jgi:alpha-1,3-rhamnosyl/mannosyltransferase
VGADAREADVYHAPHYVLPIAVRCRSVVTIHDCIHLMFPQYLPNRAAYAYARGAMWSAAQASDRILTCRKRPSATSCILQRAARKDIASSTTPSTSASGSSRRREDIERVRERFQLDQRFVLYAGTIKPHKNLVRLIEAFAELRKGEFEN